MTTTHGGARPKQRPDDKRSNNSRMVRRIRLSVESARTCRILGYRSQEQIERFVDELIEQKWQAYDATVSRHADELAEVEIKAIIL